jgi:hypothetical protein
VNESAVVNPDDVDVRVLLSPTTENGSPPSYEVEESSSTVQRLAAMVKEQQKTIELLLQEVTRRPRQRPKTAETRQRGTSKDGLGPPAFGTPTSGSVTKARTKRGALGPLARVNTAETLEAAGCIRCQRVKKRVSHRSPMV